MKNLNDIFSGAVLLCLCAVGAYEVSASIAPSDGEVVGAEGGTGEPEGEKLEWEV